jgi:hypothetical protein
MGEGKLYINDRPVGRVLIQRIGPSWSHGQFLPNEAFSAFSAMFRRWSLLMHGDGNYERLSEAARAGLRQAEFAIDGLDAKLHLLSRDEWVNCAQLNIDGSMIEWKSF